MGDIVSAVLHFFARAIRRIDKYLFALAEKSSSKKRNSISETNKKKWYADKGDETLRVEYPELGPASLVLDVGGYEGDWAAEIAARYNSEIHIYEPVPSFVDLLKKRFDSNPKIRVHPFGLSNKECELEFQLMEEASSAFRDQTIHKKGTPIKVKMFNVEEVFKGFSGRTIDLIKINIEGGEFDLLDKLLDTGDVSRISNIQVQFHDFYPFADSRMSNIQSRLTLTHEMTWQYPYVWENWKLKKRT